MIQRTIHLVGALLCAVTLHAGADELDSLVDGEPDVRALQRAAVAFIGCDPDSVRRMEQDARALRPMPDARARLLKEQRVRMDRRDEVLDRVTDLYYERLRARIRLAGDPDLPPEERLELRLRIDEAGARLDALTEGEFTRLLRRQREEGERSRVGYRREEVRDRGARIWGVEE